MFKKILFLFVLVFSITSIIQAEDYIDLVKKGNDAYRTGDYKSAMDQYIGADKQLPNSPKIAFNKAGAAFQLEDYDQAIELYSEALNTSDIDLEAKAHYNLGNAKFRKQDYEGAINSYQSTLNLNPDDQNAKFNLELARKMIKENTQPEQKQNQDQKQDQQQQQEQEQKDQEQQEQEQQEQQDEQDQQDQQDQQQQNNEQQENQDQQKQQQQQEQQQKELSKEQAERILNALRDDERDQQKKIKRHVRAGTYTGKDW